MRALAENYRFLVTIFLCLTSVLIRPSFAADRPAVAKPSDNSTPSLNVEAIVSRMEEFGDQNRSNTHAYLLTRHYQILKSNGEANKIKEADVTAEVSFIPPGSKEFQIREAHGSDRAEGVVRKILEHEKKAAAIQDSATEITRDNYDFKLLDREVSNGHDCYVLELLPKRNESNLIKGKVWIDAQHYQIWRVAGVLAKSPSWMVKDVQITIGYGTAQGMWLPVSSSAIADVRLAGRYQVDAEAVEIENSQVLASREVTHFAAERTEKTW